MLVPGLALCVLQFFINFASKYYHYRANTIEISTPN